MKTYRRILVPVPAGGQSDLLLQRAAELAKAQHAQMLVVRVIDTRSGFEPDGPAAVLPGEAAARRAPQLKKRLELQLSRNNLGWADMKVVWGEPKAMLARAIRDWSPDLVVAFAGEVSQGMAQDADILNVRAGGSLFRRMAETFQQFVPRHA